MSMSVVKAFLSLSLSQSSGVFFVGAPTRFLHDFIGNCCKINMKTALMVAEKPSLAQNLANILSNGKCSTNKGIFIKPISLLLS